MGIGQWASGIGEAVRCGGVLRCSTCRHRELVITDDAAMRDKDAARTTRENTHGAGLPMPHALCPIPHALLPITQLRLIFFQP
jgi:hypothetical protein